MSTFSIPKWGVIDMGVRRKARIFAVQFLYMFDYNKHSSVNDFSYLFDYFKIPDSCQPFAKSLFGVTLDNLEGIDLYIKKASTNWPISRMAKVDKAILRVAVSELFYIADIPYNVTINEAIEISKNFSSEDSPMFVNGVLDKIAKTNINKIKTNNVSLLDQKDPDIVLSDDSDDRYNIKMAK